MAIMIHQTLVITFGILGNIASIFSYLAPLPTFLKICRRKSTLGFESLTYVTALLNAMIWLYYAFLIPHPILLFFVNSFGCLIETIYIAIYIVYAQKEARNQTMKLLGCLNVGLFSLILLFTIFVVDSSKRVAVVGWACVAISIAGFAAPLTIVVEVVRTRSVEYMPIALSFSLTLSAVFWFSYGLGHHNLYLEIANSCGFFLGVVQMVLYGMYKNANIIKKEKHKTEENISIMIIGTPEVHPFDGQGQANGIENNGTKIENFEDEQLNNGKQEKI